MTEILERASDAGYFTLLPRELYTDAAVFEEEFRRVFSRQWLFVGHTSQLTEPGNYFVEEIIGESVVVTRNEDGSLRAFLNVCRHRGHPVCSEPEGKTKRFVCFYHRWSYNLDGELVGAPATPDGERGVRYKDLSLFHVHVTSFHGLIFVALGGDRPPELSDHLKPLTTGIERFELTRIKEAFREVHKVRSNWKVLLENYLECHHCAGAHPGLSKPMDLNAMFEATEGWEGEYFGGSMPLREGALTASLDGQLMSIPLGQADPANADDVVGTGFGIVPTLSRVIVHLDHIIVHFMRPVSLNQVEWHTRWYVNDRAVEGTDYVRDQLVEVWSSTNREDVQLCQGAFKGVTSRRFVSGPLHYDREAAIRSALYTYRTLMGTSSSA